MKDLLAEQLLAKVMGWTAEDIARERPDLQAVAEYKYDEYQQFSPGMRFVESLALWLNQFSTIREKEVAYDFLKKQLIFCSSAEISHLVSIAYPHHIRQLLLRKTARESGLDERHVARVAHSNKLRVRRRRCLFLGLSDGARIDIFRRYNNQELSHEQIVPTYQISQERAADLLSKLRDDLRKLLGEEPTAEMQKFRTVILLDDFSASGLSYLRRGTDNTFDGKIGNFLQSITDPSSAISTILEREQLEVVVVLYLATEQAREVLESLIHEACKPKGIEASLQVIHQIRHDTRIRPGDGNSMGELIEKYYDNADETEHTRKGGTDLRYGFAGCGLPIVLHHNTPNNSLYLLWAEKSIKIRPLFPRVSRHR